MNSWTEAEFEDSDDGAINYIIRDDNGSYTIADNNNGRVIESGLVDIFDAMTTILSMHNINVEF